jgi:tight adherence protein B
VTVLVPVATGLLTFAAAFLVLTTQRRALVRDRMSPYLANAEAGSVRSRMGRRRKLAGAADGVLERYNVRGPLAGKLDRAGFDVSTGVFALVTCGIAGTVFVAFLVASGLALALVGGAVALAGPVLALEVIARRRAVAFEQQLPEILDTLAASLKAGHGFDHAMHTVSTDVADPAGREFRRIVAESQLGRPLEDGLADLGKRVRSDDFNFVLDAIMIQRQVGGSLAGLFEIVAETVRAREEFRRKLKALTGMVRTSANVLTFLPVAVAALLSVLNPGYMSVFYKTGAGHIMAVIGALMIIVGAVMLRKIGKVEA